jgi:hypothetical protein
VLSDGLRTYLTYLAGHPYYLLRSLWHSPNRFAHAEMPDDQYSVLDLFSIPYRPGLSVVTPFGLGIWGYPVDAAPYPGWLRDFLLAPLGWLVVLSYLAVAGFNYLRHLIRGTEASTVEILGLAAFGTIFVVYHSEAWDTWRHTVPLVIAIYASFLARCAALVEWATTLKPLAARLRQPG